MNTGNYDVIAVGTGFATSFFLHKLFEKSKRPPRVLVLEQGQRYSHRDLLNLRLSSESPYSKDFQSKLCENKSSYVDWHFFTGFGGGSNCWYAATPRFLPEDFQLKTLFGVGEDWPYGYQELEPFYAEAEQMMQVAGDSSRHPYPGKVVYPQKPHLLSCTDELLMEAFPDMVFPAPSARSSASVPNGRNACCNNSVCALCPIDSKFTILNGLSSIYDAETVTLKYGCKVLSVATKNGVATGVNYETAGKVFTANADLVCLGANAIFNSHIMLNSGLDDGVVGRGLCGKPSVNVEVDLDGISGLNGSTYCTALCYNFYKNRRRSHEAAALIECVNRPMLRSEYGKWSDRIEFVFMFESFRQNENQVRLGGLNNSSVPVVDFKALSPQTTAGIERVKKDTEALVGHLPVENIRLHNRSKGDSHIIGTTPMGTDPESSVVDGYGLHHKIRNLMVLGSGTFPTASPSNPTLTICATALRSAQYMAI
jgi:choline dehydrogenase-like flavoprotein